MEKRARVLQSNDKIEILVWSKFGWTVDSAYQIVEVAGKSAVNTLLISRLMLLTEHGYTIDFQCQ